jgi:hypothetical protein
LQVQGLQRQPPVAVLQLHAGAVCSIFSMAILLLSNSGRIAY